MVFHSDDSLISDVVLDPKAENSHLAVITHEQGTSPAWLISALIENALVGSAQLVNSTLTRSLTRAQTILVLFLHPFEFYRLGCLKAGLDLSQMGDRFCYIDCFSSLFTHIIPTPGRGANALFGDFLQKQLALIDPNSVVIVDSPQILLGATLITLNDLIAHMAKLNRLCRQMFVVVAKDYPQSVETASLSADDAVFKLTDFITKSYYRAQLVINLMPLPTGRAKDITGIVTVSKSAIPYVCPLRVVEREYIYLLTKDGNVKLFFR